MIDPVNRVQKFTKHALWRGYKVAEFVGLGMTTLLDKDACYQQLRDHKLHPDARAQIEFALETWPKE